jgi:hypothetical protein
VRTLNRVLRDVKEGIGKFLKKAGVGKKEEDSK